MMLTSSVEKRTLSAGLAILVGSNSIKYGPTLAATVISIAPLMILFLFCQRFLWKELLHLEWRNKLTQVERENYGDYNKRNSKICGVSRTTVHRALNNTGRISEKQKDDIGNCWENGYRPDLLATGLAKGKTYYIGVVVMDVNNRYFLRC